MQWSAGDVLCCYGTDWLSRAIRVKTSWPFDPCSVWDPPSHIGIITDDASLGRVLVESTTICAAPCLVARRRKSGIQVHPPDERVADYTRPGGRVDVYRQVGIHRLGETEIHRLNLALRELIEEGAEYDKLGALISGLALSSVTRWSNASLRTLFCSELVAAVLMRVNLLNRDNPMRYSPGRLLRELLRTGVYRRVRQHLPQGVIRFGNYAELRLHG